MRRWTGIDSIALAAVTTASALIRLIRVDLPKEWVFDEIYYAKDSCLYLDFSLQTCGTEGGLNEVHPPLGKWIIALGIRIFGYDSYGWRIAAVVGGTATVVLLYLLARRLLRSTLAATLASGLLAIDVLHLVQSRISMLDVFVPLFGVAAFLFLVYDRDAMARAGPGSFRRPWRWAAGIAVGAAIAVKWTALPLWLGVIAIAVAWEVGARRRDPNRSAARAEALSIGLWLVVVPVLLYVATYVARLDGDVLALPWSEQSWFRAWWDEQRSMADFHFGLDSTHPYQSPAWSWLLLKRPVSYFFCAGDRCSPPIPDDYYREILATGNPFVWWPSVLALVFVAFRWFRTRDFTRPEGLILGGFVYTYGPWLALSLISDRSATFLFYLLPTLPFMMLALAYVAITIGTSWEARAAVSLFGVGAIVLFGFYYPLAANVPIPRSQWERRIWIFDACTKPEGVPTTTTVTETSEGSVVTRTRETKSNESLPPTGWCWI